MDALGICVSVLTADNVTGVGAADDVLLIPAGKLMWDLAGYLT